MPNARSYATRFSGLILFLLSLGVVGLLVFLTIRSARDEDAAVTQNTSSTSTEQERAQSAEDDATQTPAAEAETEPEPAPTTPPAVTSPTPAATSPTPSVGQVAAANTNALPNTGAESAVLAALGLGVLTVASASYWQSRRDLLGALSKR